MNKIRSSRELKESIQNIDRVIENEVNIDPVVSVDPVTVDAYQENNIAEDHVEEVLDELNKKAEDVIVEDPESPLPVENAYTEKLKLDEGMQDFSLMEDGRKNRVSARDDTDTNLYLDYDMLEFVYELLSAGSKGITNIAPKTPMVHRMINGRLEKRPMKKFSPNGSQVINKEYILLLDLSATKTNEIRREISKFPTNITATIKKYASMAQMSRLGVQEAFDMLIERLRALGVTADRNIIGHAFIDNLKTLSTPQISQAGYDIVVYSNIFEDFAQAQEGLDTYGISYGEPVRSKNFLSHWDWSMVVHVPCYSDGEPMLLEDWMDENGYQIEDIMEPKIAQRFRAQYAKADKAAQELAQKMVYEKWVTYAFNHGDEDLEDIYQKLCDELAERGIECSKKFHDKFMAEFDDDFEDDDIEELSTTLASAEK